MRSSQKGFTLVEITVTLAIVSVIMIVTYQLIEQTMTATVFSESHNDLAVLSQKAVNTIQTEVLQAKLVYEEDAVGAAYRSALAFPTTPSIWTTSRLPVIDDTTTTFTPDTAAARFTGNTLFLVRQLAPLAVLYDHDSSAGTPDIEFLADRYTFEYFYLRNHTGQSFAGSGQSVDLMLATSGEYADYFQLASVTANRGVLVQKLMNAGLSRAWDPGRPLASAFYQLSSATDGTFDPPLNSPTIPIVRTKSLLPGLFGGRISGRVLYSVGFPRSSGPAFPIPQPLSVFGQSDVSLPGYPAGFEVKIIGPSRNRQVLTRLVLMAHYARNYEAQQATVYTAARF
ncbi:MAG TPA: prepilin-type N-terminal cleavage/methylation domain-containing protein [Thermoanaerobaculia bacterium]|nr:prepilin-type N-terminal cleavage/methylation domain-containing protein [Thermoanaerobaculia bacterium]